jgi:TolB-like protein
MSAPDIFLSYNREDAEIARTYAEAFTHEGFSVWWDATLRSGEAYDEVTEAALRGAKAVVVLWSPRSVASRWVRAEATIADRNRTLMPVTIEACERPVMFELTQTAELSHWRGEVGDPAWRVFLADVRRVVEAGAMPERPATPGTSAGFAPPRRGARPSIAVLPFINRSGLSEDDVFADGMVEDLTAALSVIRTMKVIASSATAAYRKGARDLRQIGRVLGVRYLLEGNVRRVGSDLRVTAQLVEAEDGDILWAHKFYRPLEELAALQEDLVTEVAACLGVEVHRAEMEHALRKPGDITAWEAVMRAEAGLCRNTPSGAEAAVAEARRAIEIDPDYDAAHAILAVALTVLLALRGNEDAALAQELVDTVNRARAFESNDPIVLARIAAALAVVMGHQDALPIAERAVAVNPNLEHPRLALGKILLRLGRWDDAIAESRAAERLAPNGIWSHAPAYTRSLAHFHAGRLEQALEAIDQSLRCRPAPLAQIHRIICLAMLDRWGEAREAMRGLRHSSTRMSLPLVEKLGPYGHFFKGIDAGRVDEIVAIVRKLWDETEGEA